MKPEVFLTPPRARATVYSTQVYSHFAKTVSLEKLVANLKNFSSGIFTIGDILF